LKTLKQLNVLLGLVTGNLEPMARGKLKKVNINQYFKVGGFGSDNADRTKLVKIAIKQAQKLNFTPSANIILFGDTPKDIAAGKQAEVKTAGIATGIYTVEKLKQSGADFVFENLLDTDLVVNTLLK
jgi:phosphoglycolate phosphatase-like HAD superfamily hydrolase